MGGCGSKPAVLEERGEAVEHSKPHSKPPLVHAEQDWSQGNTSEVAPVAARKVVSHGNGANGKEEEPVVPADRPVGYGLESEGEEEDEVRELASRAQGSDCPVVLQSKTRDDVHNEPAMPSEDFVGSAERAAEAKDGEQQLKGGDSRSPATRTFRASFKRGPYGAAEGGAAGEEKSHKKGKVESSKAKGEEGRMKKGWGKEVRKESGGKKIAEEASDGKTSGKSKRRTASTGGVELDSHGEPRLLGRTKARSGVKSPTNYSRTKLVRTSSGGLMKALSDSLGDIGITISGAAPNSAGPSTDDMRSKAKPSRGSRIDIVAFEIANVIVRGLMLKNSLQSGDIEELRTEVLASEGVRTLVSEDEFELWCIAAEDKRMELRAVAREVARLGKLCTDAAYHRLDVDFNMLGTVEEPTAKMTADEMETEFKNLELQAQVTAELYHELNTLKSLEQVYNRKLKDEEKNEKRKEKASGEKDHLAALRNEIKAQEKTVRGLKRKGLWTKRLDTVVEKLTDVVIHLHLQIVAVFGPQAVKMGGLMDRPRESPRDLQKLGVSGLGTHYANIINVIDNLVMRPFAHAQLRDSLYNMLTPQIRRKLKRGLLNSQEVEQVGAPGPQASRFSGSLDTDTIQDGMENVLDWLVTMAGNTLRYAGDRRLQGHTELTLLQTLHHADQERTEELMVDLLVSLNHLASRTQKQGVPGEPVRSPIPHNPFKPTSSAAQEKGSVRADTLLRLLEMDGQDGVASGEAKASSSPSSSSLSSEDRDDEDPWQEFRRKKDAAEEERRAEGLAADPKEVGQEEPTPVLKKTPSRIRHVAFSDDLHEHLMRDKEGWRTGGLTSEGAKTGEDSDNEESDGPPILNAYRAMLSSLPDEDQEQIAKLALTGKGAPPGISKSLNFISMKKGRAAALLLKDNGRPHGSLPRIYSDGLRNLAALKAMESAGMLSPRTSLSRSLSRSTTFHPSSLTDELPKTPRVRAMVPALPDVDRLGEDDQSTEGAYTRSLSL